MRVAVNRRVLLIDDTPSIHEDFRKILASGTASGLNPIRSTLFGDAAPSAPLLDFELDSAFQGSEALPQIEASLREGRPYAMAFVDMRMPPGWDGIETIERIWKLDPRLQVVICTAYSDYPWGEALSRLNVGDRLLILKKPFDTIEVHQLANALTTKWTMARQAEQQQNQLEAVVQVRTRELHNQVAERRLRDRAIESAVNAVVIVDYRTPDYPIEYVNPAFEQITGYTSAEVLGRNIRFLHGDDHEQASIQEALLALKERRSCHVVLRNYRKDGSLFWNDLHLSPVRDDAGDVTHFVGVLNDITEARDYQRQLEHQANYDALTDLPNRNLLKQRMAQAISHAQRKQGRVAVLWLDLDRFKFVNDNYGHAVGDALLKNVATRLIETVGAGVTLARVGGDEFVVMIPMLAAPAEAEELAQLLQQAISLPFEIAEHQLQVGASIGVSIYPEDGVLGEVLLKHADAAMYCVKERGRDGYQFHTPGMIAREHERAELEQALRLALGRQEFELHYQPQVDTKTGKLRGIEALIRWHHPELGLIVPDRFIALAEDMGQIIPIGEWVLRTACAQAKAWQNEGLPGLRMAVNVSARQFRHKSFSEQIRQILIDTGLDAAYLELELTETVLMQDSDEIIKILNEIKALGVTISLDDFGTGYSNLSYLKRFPLDFVKIDKSFIRDVTTEPDDASISKAIINMGHVLGLKVIAEGVETEGQEGFLRSNQCDVAQGYLFSYPQSADEIAVLLRDRQWQGEAQRHIPKHRRTLLLVDDEALMLKALRRVLRGDGYQILTATDGLEALEILARHPVDVIISDQRMPGMDGVELLRRVNKIYPSTVRIVLSGYADLDAIIAAVNEGAINKFLTKPWDNQIMRECIAEAFSRKEEADKNRRLMTQALDNDEEWQATREELLALLARKWK